MFKTKIDIHHNLKAPVHMINKPIQTMTGLQYM